MLGTPDIPGLVKYAIQDPLRILIPASSLQKEMKHLLGYSLSLYPNVPSLPRKSYEQSKNRCKTALNAEEEARVIANQCCS